ncbi:unnamed protein product [Prunus brigantina]
MLVTTILNQPVLPSFIDLRSRLLVFDNQSSRSSAGNTTALITTHNPSAHSLPQGHTTSQPGPSPQRGSSRGGRHGGYRGFSRGGSRRSGPNRWHTNVFPGASPAWNQPWTGSTPIRGSAPRPHWNQHGILGPPPPTWCPTCSTNQHPAAHCPHKYNGPDSFPSFAGSHTIQPQDPLWYPDTGATHHMTGNIPSLQQTQPYTGNNSVYMGNGDSLPISHTGNLPLSLGLSQFSLRNVFGVPNLTKNLLSVAKFTHDNHVFFVFAPTFYRIFDLHTGALLFQGPCKDGLYPLTLSSSSAPPVPHAFVTTSSSTWHNRLGHPLHHKGYRCLDPNTGRVYISRNVIFNELCFPFKTLRYLAPAATVELDIFPQGALSPPLPRHSYHNPASTRWAVTTIALLVFISKPTASFCGPTIFFSHTHRLLLQARASLQT